MTAIFIVATFLGCLFGFAWPAGLAFCAIWLLVAKFSRYSSLSALVASAASPLITVVVTGAKDSTKIGFCLAKAFT